MLARPPRNYDAFHRKREQLRPDAAAICPAVGDEQLCLPATGGLMVRYNTLVGSP